MICRAVVVVLTLSAGIGFGSASAQTAIEASPLRVEIKVEPGGTHTQAVTIRNPGSERVRATIEVPFPRPRSPLLVADPDFGRLKAEVLATLEDAAP